jgi:hypothetical protein
LVLLKSLKTLVASPVSTRKFFQKTRFGDCEIEFVKR